LSCASLGLVFAGSFGSAQRHVEIVEDAEDFVDRFVAGRSRLRRLRKHDGPNETGRWGEVARKADHTAAAAERLEVQVIDPLIGYRDRRQGDVIPEIGLVPVVGWRVGDDAERRVNTASRPFAYSITTAFPLGSVT
jgi:hypothetical protein